MKKEDKQTMNIEDLRQDGHNFNKGTHEGQRLIEKSFKELGAGRSILIDKDNNIIAGNKSQQAAIASGIQKVRVIETDGTELIAVKRTDVELDSAKGRLLAFADNKTAEVNLSWDEVQLSQIETEVEDFAVADWSGDVKDVAEDKEAEEDGFDEEKETIEARTVFGDLWQLGEHRLKCGDSLNAEDVADLMKEEKCDLWLTDPPYNVNVQNSDGLKIANDNMSGSDFADFLTKAFTVAYDVMAKGCSFYIWYATCEHINFEQSLNRARLKVKQQLIWNKNHFTLGRCHYQWKHEPCLYGWKGNSCRYFTDSRKQATVITDAEELNFNKMKAAEMRELLTQIFAEKTATPVINEKKPLVNREHPTMKPVKLFGYLICNSSKKGDIVFDNFGGSGTTIVACEQLGRKARLMEYAPHFCDVIIARWEKLTGQKAIKLNNKT